MFLVSLLDSISFKLINTASAIVCVPGARNNMLDRGQSQQMAFGACTISPKLVTRLSYHGMLIPGVHYVECKSDYSDLIEKANWVINNRSKAIKIGNAAKKLFSETSTPVKQEILKVYANFLILKIDNE